MLPHIAACAAYKRQHDDALTVRVRHRHGDVTRLPFAVSTDGAFHYARNFVKTCDQASNSLFGRSRVLIHKQDVLTLATPCQGILSLRISDGCHPLLGYDMGVS